MTHAWIIFVASAAALLLAPGPTNMLLLLAGAARGFGRSLGFVVAELCGYALSVFTLTLVFGPFFRDHPQASTLLCVVAATYLGYVAWRSWRAPTRESGNVTGRGRLTVFTATVLNPKGLVFAFVLIPKAGMVRDIDKEMILALFLIMVALSGASWAFMGARLARSLTTDRANLILQRSGSLVIGAFAALLGAPALIKLVSAR